MMRVEFDGIWDVVTEATNQANLLLAKAEFYERIRTCPRFELTKASPRDIADLMERCTARLTVRLYKSRWPWSRAFGYEDARFPDMVFLNTRKLDRSMASIVGTIIHESVHAADAHSPLDFGHGSNSSADKENTAPYWIGNLAISMVSDQPFAAVDHAAIDVLDDPAEAVA
ncbi:MAG: hypothetical protein E6J91_14270 [Deltaproteobacteria bacterium]|nr:MAG: hypothetical protein E6J91_14270 [Deltaproteobacteria bacterium]